MRRSEPQVAFVMGSLLLAIIAAPQEARPPSEGIPSSNNMSDERASSTREFLGLGAQPDKAAAARAAPIYQQNCSFCHGPQARGATGPGLITSDVVLGDDHGEHFAPFLKVGRPEKGMPAFSQFSDSTLKDLAEFLHLQVESVANRGAYKVLNIVVGNAARGGTFVATNCVKCHTIASFTHIATKFRSPDQLQRSWIWPPRPGDNSLAITATVTTPNGSSISGRVTEVSDFRITLIDGVGQTRIIDRNPGVDVQMKDPLAQHQALLMTLKNSDMHNVTAYLETLK
jgi:cytochrome c oxidase cbb3-type subunit 3